MFCCYCCCLCCLVNCIVFRDIYISVTEKSLFNDGSLDLYNFGFKTNDKTLNLILYLRDIACNTLYIVLVNSF